MGDHPDNEKEGLESRADDRGGLRPPWKARTVWLAAVLVVIGSVLWLSDIHEASGGKSTAPGVSSFSEATPGSEAAAAKGKPEAPATFRFGISYIGGFVLGWGFRRFLKITLLLSVGAVVLFAVARKLHWIDLDWAWVEQQARTSLAWVEGEAGAIKDFLRGYLPSTGAAAVGLFLGFRRR